MRVLLVHNYYQIPGGEDSVFHNESTMLETHAQEVKIFTVNNDKITGKLAALKTLLGLIFSFPHYKQIKQQLRDFQPDVVHVHNYFPLISPAVFYACQSAGIPVVHTLHNFRAICPTSLLMHDGVITEKSITVGPWWAVKQRVYKGSLIGTTALALMIALHKRIGTWQHSVNGFICLTQFSKNLFSSAGWPAAKLYIKPNFLVDTPSLTPPVNIPNTGYAVFVGRLCKEKGLDQLLDAWKGITLPLLIIGDGPEKHLLDNPPPNIIYVGPKPKDEVLGYIKDAQFLVMASTWYEGFPMVLVEAFAQGTCAIVPNIGGMAEVVEPEKNGMHFEVNDSQALHDCAQAMIDNPQRCKELGINARNIFEDKYSEQVNYSQLMNIYQKVISANINSRNTL
jgi:glycosyltransferase involved in cell wall biosynthesis